VTSIALLRRLLRDQVYLRGTGWLREVLAQAGVDKISLLTRAQLLRATEERDHPDVEG
jgi:hypothetical protein